MIRAAELGAAYANPFAVGVASDVLGLGLEEIDEVHHIYTTFAEGMVGYRDPDAVARAAQGRARLDELLAPRIERVESQPDGSMLAAAGHYLLLTSTHPGGSSDGKVTMSWIDVTSGAITKLPVSLPASTGSDAAPSLGL